MNQKRQCIARAIAFLATAGVTYHIVDEDGTDIANTIPSKFKPVQQRRNYMGYKNHYTPLLRSVDNGTGSFALTIQVPEEYDPGKYRGALSASLTTTYGRGNHITHIDRKKRTIDVTVVRPDV